MSKIILASESPRRRDLLKMLDVDFAVMPSNIDEKFELSNIDDYFNVDFTQFNDQPADIAKVLAYKKACSIAKKLELGLVIGADTIVTYKGKIYGKPEDDDEAIAVLKLLSGKTHQVITGIALIDCETKKCRLDCEISKVKFSKLSNERIIDYVKTGEYKGKAGSYAIQGKGSLLVEKISGCYFNIVGLPINKLDKMMKSFRQSLLKG